MNAALRAVFRTALNHRISVFAIDEGYQGMVDGGERVHPAEWADSAEIMQYGGTVTGTARCASFRSREGRLQVARNLLPKRPVITQSKSSW